MTEKDIDNEMVTHAARFAHEVNRIYCEFMDDYSQVPWGQSPEWQRLSAIKGAMGVINGSTPEQLHLEWMNHKIEEGWKYGARKDPIAKTHPCIRMWSELPPEQRMKDILFAASVRAALTALGSMD